MLSHLFSLWLLSILGIDLDKVSITCNRRKRKIASLKKTDFIDCDIAQSPINTEKGDLLCT